MASVIQAGTASNTALTLSSDTSGELQLKTNSGSTTAMTLTTAGNVGIGTTSPSGRFHVTGGNTYLDGERVFIGGSSNNAVINSNFSFRINIDADNTGTGESFAVGHNQASIDNNNILFLVNDSGNVGIGTISPVTALNIGAAGVLQLNRSDNTRWGQIFANNSGFHVVASSNSDSLLLTAAGTGSTINFSTVNTERMRIDSSGNVGIGTSSPSTYGKVAINDNIALVNSNSPKKLSFWSTANGNSENAYIEVHNDGATTNTGEIRFATKNSGGTLAERMRVTAGGDVLFGTTTVTGAGGFSIRPNLGGAGTYCRLTLNSNGTNDVFDFQQNGTQVGRIQIAATQTFYVTTSDYRLKENVEPMTGALAKVAQLKPCTYIWKSNGSIGQGFIAHELQAVIPDAVVGEKDDLNEDGSINPQGIDTSFLVATLTAAIQEQQAMIEELKQEVAKLKGV